MMFEVDGKHHSMITTPADVVSPKLENLAAQRAALVDKLKGALKAADGKSYSNVTILQCLLQELHDEAGTETGVMKEQLKVFLSHWWREASNTLSEIPWPRPRSRDNS